jgi:glutathione S-transferase
MPRNGSSRFKTSFEGGVGETKDLRAQWALEETSLPYRVHALDQIAGDLQSEAYGKISPFHQIPVIDDDGFILSESAAIVIYLAEKAGKLIPSDIQGRTRVTQWCFAAVATIDPLNGALRSMASAAAEDLTILSSSRLCE